jgi:hypothetical protein
MDLYRVTFPNGSEVQLSFSGAESQIKAEAWKMLGGRDNPIPAGVKVKHIGMDHAWYESRVIVRGPNGSTLIELGASITEPVWNER